MLKHVESSSRWRKLWSCKKIDSLSGKKIECFYIITYYTKVRSENMGKEGCMNNIPNDAEIA